MFWRKSRGSRLPPLLAPRGPSKRKGSKTRQTVLCWLLMVLIVGLVGYAQMKFFESQLQSTVRRKGTAATGRAARRKAASIDDTLQKDADADAADNYVRDSKSSAGVCIATLEAKGVLPDEHGVRLTLEERQRRLKARKGRRWHKKTPEELAAEAAEDKAAEVPKDVVSGMLERRRLYDKMEMALQQQGLALEESTTQGLSLKDMFRIEDGKLKPVVAVLDIPVRAIIMPLVDEQAALKLESSLKQHVAPLFPKNGIWMQHPKLYHSTLFHASTHMEPHYARPRDVDMEEYEIKDVGHAACPLHLVLERVVATPSGTIVACWQIVNGTDVIQIRQGLQKVLRRASKQQVVRDRSILHMTLGRLVLPPNLDSAEAAAALEDSDDEGAVQAGEDSDLQASQVLQTAVDKMTEELCGLRAVIDKLWFVEEYERLALALRGSFKERVIPLECEPFY